MHGNREAAGAICFYLMQMLFIGNVSSQSTLINGFVILQKHNTWYWDVGYACLLVSTKIHVCVHCSRFCIGSQLLLCFFVFFLLYIFYSAVESNGVPIGPFLICLSCYGMFSLIQKVKRFRAKNRILNTYELLQVSLPGFTLCHGVVTYVKETHLPIRKLYEFWIH